MLTAIVLINVQRGKVKEVSEKLMTTEGVTQVYSLAGEYDLATMVHVKVTEKHVLSEIVTERIGHMEGIHHTKTLFVLDTQSKIDLDKVYG